MEYSLPGSSVHGILQARVLEWVVISFSRGCSRARDWTWVSPTAGRLFAVWATREAKTSKGPDQFVIHLWFHCHSQVRVGLNERADIWKCLVEFPTFVVQWEFILFLFWNCLSSSIFPLVVCFVVIKCLLSFHSHSNTISDKKQGGEQKCPGVSWPPVWYLS